MSDTRSGIPLNEIAPDAPDLRAAVAAVLNSQINLGGGFKDSPSGLFHVSYVGNHEFNALRAAYEATPAPAPAITTEERDVIGRASEIVAAYRGIVDYEFDRSDGGGIGHRLSLTLAWERFEPHADADLAVLARLAGRA